MPLNKYRPDIDGLRAVAIFFVILFHFDPLILAGGFVGVDIFFTISGFVVTLSVLSEIKKTGRFLIINFYQRRIRRLFPALFLTINVVLIYAIITNYFPLEEAVTRLIDNAFYAMFGVANIFFLNHKKEYFQGGNENEILLHTWSLSIEEQFYILFSLLVIFKLVRNNFTRLFSIIGILSLVLSISLVNKYSLESFYLIFTRAYEFVIGILIAKLSFKNDFLKRVNLAQTNILSQLLSIVGMIMILISGFAFSPKTNMPSYNALLPCIGTALIIVGGLNRNTIIYKILSFRPVVAIGKISYSLYLYHVPIFILLMGVISVFWQWFLIFIFAILSYFLIEKPLRSGKFFSRGYVVLAFILINIAILFFIKFEYKNLQNIIDNPNKTHVTNGFPHGTDSCFYNIYEQFDENRTKKCLIQKEGKNILLFGDSHSAAFSKILLETSKKYNINMMQILGSMCPPIFNSSRDYNSIDRSFCSKNTAYLRNAIDSGEIKIDGVILIAKWHDHGFTDQDKPYHELDDTINFFAEKNIDILILGDVPEFNNDLNFGNIKTKYVDHKNINEPFLKANDRIEEYLKTKNNIKYYLPFRKLCNNFYCRIMDNEGGILYNDKDHISYEGGNFLVGDIGKIFIKPLIRK